MSSTLERATEALEAQAAKGMEKYLVPLESAGHSLSELLIHKQQEVADELMYTTEAIQRARELEAENANLREQVSAMREAGEGIRYWFENGWSPNLKAADELVAAWEEAIK